MEVSYPANARWVEMVCDLCGEGTMKVDGVPKLRPIMWPHKCDKCGAVAEYGKKYPSVTFEKAC